MLKFINKSSFFIILILFISYFFVGLFNFQEKILSLEKNRIIKKEDLYINFTISNFIVLLRKHVGKKMYVSIQ